MENPKELPFAGLEPPDMAFFQRMRTTIAPTWFDFARFFGLSTAELEPIVKDCYALLREDTAYSCNTGLDFFTDTCTSEMKAFTLEVPVGAALCGWQIPWNNVSMIDALDEVFTNLVLNHSYLQTNYAKRGETTFVMLSNSTVRRTSMPSYLDDDGRTRFLPSPASMTEMIWRFIRKCRNEIYRNPELHLEDVDKLVVSTTPAKKRKVQDGTTDAARASKKKKAALVKLDNKIIVKGKDVKLGSRGW